MDTPPLMPGNASFKIIGVYDTNKDGTPLKDMAGNPKLNVGVSVKDSMGNRGMLYESLTINTGWKVKALLNAVGLEALYDKSGQLNPVEIVNGEGQCTLKLQEASNGYPSRMVVDRYLKAAKQLEIKPNFTDINDDLPF